MNKIEFECGIDLPVLQYKTDVEVTYDNGCKNNLTRYVFYDYLLDEFFIKHPYRIRRVDLKNDYMAETNAIECAKDKSINRVANVIKEIYTWYDNCKVTNIKITEIYPYSLGYKFNGELDENGYKYKFETLKLDDFAISDDDKEAKQNVLKNTIKSIYSKDIFSKAIRTLGKFKYTYKYNEFDVDIDKFISPEFLDDNEELVLCKEYYLALHNSEISLISCNENLMQFSECKTVINNNIFKERNNNEIIYLQDQKLYSLTTCEISSYVDMFDEEMDLPFLVKKELTGDELKQVALTLLKEAVKTTNADAIIALSQLSK